MNKINMRILIVFLFLLFSFCIKKEVEIVDTYKIWNKAPHNAFTALISYKGNLFCAFREAKNHHSYDGIIRVIKSSDGKNWKSLATFKINNQDLRDPKFSINSQKELVLLGVSRDKKKHYSYTWISKDGKTWSNYKTDHTHNNTWRWGAMNHQDIIYSIGYSGDDKKGKLYKSEDGEKWQSMNDNFFPEVENYPNETALFSTSKGKLIAIVRKDKGNKKAMLGTSDFPYKSWEWRELDKQMGAPAGILLNDNCILIVVRLYGLDIRTSIGIVDINKGAFRELAKLPSGGDTGYAGIVEFNNEYYISYNSSHRDKKTAIYLSKIKLLDNNEYN